jgi:hypothetical protein
MAQQSTDGYYRIDNRLVFKFQFDVDSDGELELFKAICNRYEPPVEIDIYSGTFIGIK